MILFTEVAKMTGTKQNSETAKFADMSYIKESGATLRYGGSYSTGKLHLVAGGGAACNGRSLNGIMHQEVYDYSRIRVKELCKRCFPNGVPTDDDPADKAMADAGIVRDDDGFHRITVGMFHAVRDSKSSLDHGKNWIYYRTTTGESALAFRESDKHRCRFCGERFAVDNRVIDFRFGWDGVEWINGFMHADIAGCLKANK